MLVFVMDWSSSPPGNRPFDAPARTPVSRQGVYPPLLSVSLPGCDGEPFFTNFCICHTSKKCAGNSFPCHTSNNTRFKTLCLPHIQRMTGGGGYFVNQACDEHACPVCPGLPGERPQGVDRSLLKFQEEFLS